MEKSICASSAVDSFFFCSIFFFNSINFYLSNHLQIPVNYVVFMEIPECTNNLCPVKTTAIFAENSFPRQMEEQFTTTGIFHNEDQTVSSLKRILELLQK